MDGPLGRVDSMIVGLDELPFAIFFLEVFLEGNCCLIVRDIEHRFVSLLLHVCENFIERFDDCGVLQILDRLGNNIIVVIIVCNKILLVALEGHDGEGTCSIGV